MLDPIFRPEVDFGNLLEAVVTAKVGFVAQALQPVFAGDLLAEVRASKLEVVTTDTGKVQERYDRTKLVGREHFTPKVAELADYLAWGVRLGSSSRRPFAHWQPNDIESHRYRPGDIAITSHRDYQCNQDFVVVFTLAGYGTFYVHGAERHGRPRTFHTGPGSMVVLDITQFHSVDPPLTDERWVLVMWMRREA